MKKNNKLEVWMISMVSVFLNEPIATTQGNLVDWVLNDGSQIVINFDEKEVAFVDWLGDEKTYFSIVGLALSIDFTTQDCYTKK